MRSWLATRGIVYYAQAVACLGGSMSRALVALIAVTACIEEQTPIDTTGDVATSPDSTSEPCDTPGVTRCNDDLSATEFCSGGVWIPEACGEGKLCIVAGAAQCVDSTGDATCRSTLYCFIGCQVAYADDDPAIESCMISCFRGATREDQVELSVATDCFERRCGEDASFDCIAASCSQALGDCYFDTSGSESCGQIITCRTGCDGDEVCGIGCGDDGSIPAQSTYAVLELCIFYACFGEDGDCPRRVGLLGGACSDYTNACVGLPGVGN